MSIVAQPGVPVAGRRRTRLKRQPVGSGIAWIVVVAVLLAGVVAVNVVVLELNVALDRLGRERAQLEADSALLRSHLSSASANARIEELAASRLGLVTADPAATTYIRLSGGRH